MLHANARRGGQGRAGARKCQLAGVLALAWLPGIVAAGPDIDPGPLFNFLPAQRGTLVTRLHNQGDATAFVKIELAELSFDEQDDPYERSLALEDGMKRALLATPPRAIVPAGGSQAIRLIYRGQRDRERYFRVRYVPVAPEPGDAFALQPEEAKAYAESINAGVGVLKAIGTVLVVPPAKPRYATRLEPGNQRLRIINDGDATVSVVGPRYCQAASEQCELAGALHIRPGQRAEVARKPGQVYRFELREGRRVTPHTYPSNG